MKQIPADEASRLCIMVQMPKSLIKNQKARRRWFSQFRNQHARKIGLVMLDIFRGRKVPQSPERRTALGIIGWAFTNHTAYHLRRKESPRCILTCKCGLTEHRNILKKYGELEKIAARLTW